MQAKSQIVEQNLIEEMERLILSIRKELPNKNEEEIAVDLGYNEGYFSQTRSRGKVSKKFIDKVKNYLSSLQNAKPKQKTEVFDLSTTESSQPFIQVILNLTYVGKKNADSIDKMAIGVNTMAATNQRNTDIIAALVAEAFPNSKFAAGLITSLADPHTDDDLPFEAFLGDQKDNPLKRQKQTDKSSAKGK